MTHTLPDQAYVHEFEFAQDSQWGEVVLMLASHRDESRIMRDPEAIRCAETGYSPADIWLGKRTYSDDQLGVLDGPMRDRQPLVDTFAWTARTPKASLTKRQRRKLRKASRAAKRAGKAFDEAQFITVEFVA